MICLENYHWLITDQRILTIYVNREFCFTADEIKFS